MCIYIYTHTNKCKRVKTAKLARHYLTFTFSPTRKRKSYGVRWGWRWMELMCFECLQMNPQAKSLRWPHSREGCLSLLDCLYLSLFGIDLLIFKVRARVACPVFISHFPLGCISCARALKFRWIWCFRRGSNQIGHGGGERAVEIREADQGAGACGGYYSRWAQSADRSPSGTLLFVIALSPRSNFESHGCENVLFWAYCSRNMKMWFLLWCFLDHLKFPLLFSVGSNDKLQQGMSSTVTVIWKWTWWLGFSLVCQSSIKMKFVRSKHNFLLYSLQDPLSWSIPSIFCLFFLSHDIPWILLVVFGRSTSQYKNW